MPSRPRSEVPTRIALIGGTGRMGKALVRAAPSFSALKIVAAVASASSAALGRDVGEVAGIAPLGISVTDALARALEGADVALDFSSASATARNLEACRKAKKPLLIGTSGIASELEASLSAAAREIPLLIAANTSIAVTLLIELVRAGARTLPPGFDIDIVESHHRTKPDAPSGTALALARAAREARRAPPQARPLPGGEGGIGIASVRAGDLVGEHSVLFTGNGEQLVLTHRASDRAIFARGALEAALWLAMQPPGRYAMRDVLGVETVT